MDLKRVRDAARSEDPRARCAPDGLIADPGSDLAIKNVETLILITVDMARWAIALAGECVDEGESSQRLVTGGEETEKPAGVPE
jgi:hypothetical protein